MNTAIVHVVAALICIAFAFRAVLPHTIIPVLVLVGAKWVGAI